YYPEHSTANRNNHPDSGPGTQKSSSSLPGPLSAAPLDLDRDIVLAWLDVVLEVRRLKLRVPRGDDQGGRRTALHRRRPQAGPVRPSLDPRATLPPAPRVQGECPVLFDLPAGQLRGIGDGLKLYIVPRQIFDVPSPLVDHCPLGRVHLRARVAARQGAQG